MLSKANDRGATRQMPRLLVRAVLLATSLVAAGCSGKANSAPSRQVTQFSIINALMLGQYDGFVTIEDVLRYGNFGVGACDQLDGELIILDGHAFQAKADGAIVELPHSAKIPLAVVAQFDKPVQTKFPSFRSLEALEASLDDQLENRELFYAVRVETALESITFRSVPKQDRPYRPLTEVARDQVIHTAQQVSGTLIGIRTPQWAGSLGVPGYHWHFIDSDRQRGGHVLNCVILHGRLGIKRCDAWLVKLPETLGESGHDVSADMRREVDQIERSRQPDAKENKQ